MVQSANGCDRNHGLCPRHSLRLRSFIDHLFAGAGRGVGRAHAPAQVPGAKISVSQGVGGMFGAGPEIPMVLQYESHAIVRPLARVPTAFPLSRSLEIKSGGKTTVEKLLGTTEDSIAASEIGAGGAVDPKKGKKGPLALAVAGTYSGMPAGRFIVVGTSQWAENRAMGSRTLGNRDLFMNMINWLTSDEDLISIRPKSPEDRPLRNRPPA